MNETGPSQEKPTVRIDRPRPHVARLTLADEKRKNVMTPELGDAFQRALDSLQEDIARGVVRAQVLVGAGDAFSSGGDLAMLERLRSVPFTESYEFMLGFYARFLAITKISVPTIAAVHGPAIGAGLALALACDLTLFAEDAKLAVNFVALGLHPGLGSTYTVAKRAGVERARELFFTGRRFDGAEAVRLGLGLEALPASALVERALALAGKIAEMGPLAVRATKRTLALDPVELERALQREAFAQAESYTSAELGEGLAAAKAKRKPSWSAS